MRRYSLFALGITVLLSLLLATACKSNKERKAREREDDKAIARLEKENEKAAKQLKVYSFKEFTGTVRQLVKLCDDGKSDSDVCRVKAKMLATQYDSANGLSKDPLFTSDAKNVVFWAVTLGGLPKDSGALEDFLRASKKYLDRAEEFGL